MSRPLRLAAIALIAVFAAIAVANALTYPPGLGYDASDHIEYAEGLIEHREFPEGVGEYYTPPLFYALAGSAGWLGEQVGLGEPRRFAQLLNAVYAVGTALLLLALGRTIWPARPILHVAALGVFTAGALVLKAAAMYHPETLSLFLSTLALVLAARMVTRREYTLPYAAALGVALGAGQLVRAFALWTTAVVLLTLLAVVLTQRGLRRDVLRAAAVVLVGIVVVAGPWYLHQAQRYSNPIFDRPQVEVPLWERRPASFYLDPGLPELITAPHRPHFVNRFWAELYAEGWGDWYGIFSWRAAQEQPTTAERRELVAQSVVGIVPTLLAVAGWLGLLWASLRRLGARPERLLVSLLPLAGIAGMLYFTVSYPTPDGDVIKATYMLTTAPAWALCFGLAVDAIALRRRRLALALAILFGLSALVSFRYALYPSLLGGLL